LAKTDQAFIARVQADIDGYKKDHELLIDRYVRTIERLGRKHTSALSGQEGREKDRIREAIQDAVREVEKSGKLLAEVPKSAPDDFHDLQKKTKNSEVELIEEFQKKLSSQVGTYTLGLTKQAGQLTSDGYTEAAAAINSRLEKIDGKAVAFLELLGLDDPTASAPAAPAEEEKKQDPAGT
jgi:predicted phage tail protein